MQVAVVATPCSEQMTLSYILNICVQLTSGLRHLHAACGVLHRDLKSDNALVASKDPLIVKWADFGCSIRLMSGTTSASAATYSAGVAWQWGHVVTALLLRW